MTTASPEGVAAFYGALDRHAQRGDYDTSRQLGWIDSNVDDVVASLEADGWQRPGASPETAEQAEARHHEHAQRDASGVAVATLETLAEELGFEAGRWDPGSLLEAARARTAPAMPARASGGSALGRAFLLGAGAVSGARASDPDTSHEGAQETGAARQAQRLRLLDEFREAGAAGLTDEEAAQAAGLWDTRSCWWHRCTDLRAEGWIEWTNAKREGAMGRLRKVSRAVAERGATR